MKRESRNTAASVRDRLYNLAQREKRDFNLVLTAFATERFLYRLASSKYTERFVLKGARLLALSMNRPYRPTRDLDLLGFGDASPAALRHTFASICRAHVEQDGMVFDANSMSIAEIRLGQEYGGQRVKLTAHLAQARIPLQIDVGFGDAITPKAQLLDYTPLLDALPAPRIRAYPLETVLAEKLQAIVALGALNTRMKDFYDIFVLAGHFDYDGPVLCQAIQATFDRRKTPIPSRLPLALQPSFAEDPERKRLWKGFLWRSAVEDPESFDLASVLERVRDFLGPPLLAAGQEVPSFALAWRSAEGRWSQGP